MKPFYSLFSNAPGKENPFYSFKRGYLSLIVSLLFITLLLISEKARFNQKWWLKLAAVMISIIGVAGFMYSANSKAIQEREALAALKQSKDAMYLMASQFNKAAQRLSLVDEFQVTKNKYLK